MYVITAHQRHGRTDGRTSSDPMTATLLKHVAVKTYNVPREIGKVDKCVGDDLLANNNSQYP